MTAWIFQANPDHFDIDGYLGQSPATLSWVARQFASEMTIGDQVFVWRAIGSGAAKLSGIVAEGYIEDLPTKRDDDPESLTFWHAGLTAAEPRVRLRLTRIEIKHRFERHWLDDDPIMKDASILTLRAGTNFRLNHDQAARLNALWRRAKVPWSYSDTIAGLWAFSNTLGGNLSRKADAPIVAAALRTGRVVKGMYNKVLNFRSLDSSDSRAGLDATSLMDREVWDRFYDQTTGALRGGEIEAEFARLWPSADLPLPEQPSVEQAAAPLTRLSLEELLARYEAKAKGKNKKPRTYRSSSSQFERDPEVVAIALVRANGKCELPDCGHPLFLNGDKRPFLEVHHIEPLSEGGADCPENVASVCPSHHREAHHGVAAPSIRALLRAIRASEAL